MKFSINKSQVAVLITLLVLIFLGAAYFFIYLPQNEKRIQEHRFNTLKNIDRNIHTKIENSIALLNNLHSPESYDSQKLQNYIRGYSANFTLFSETIPLSKTKIPKDSIHRDSVYSITVDNNTREINLSFSKKQIKKERKDIIINKLSMKFSFEQFLNSLLSTDVFDEYIIFSNGRSVYETFPAGISYVIEDSLLSVKNGFGTSAIKNQVISGTEYKLFLQPVGFDSNNEWVICGLLSSSDYQKEKNKLPTQAILLLSTITLIGVIAFPWLKLYQMGSKDRLTISDGIASIFISMILVSLIFFVFFNYNVPFRPTVTEDPKNTLAEQIEKAFKTEIEIAHNKLRQMDALMSAADRKDNIRNVDIINLGHDSMAFSNEDPLSKPDPGINNIVSGIKPNFVFWLNKEGREIINWTPDAINAPHGDFKNREYFKRIITGREYLLNADTGSKYFLDQGFSWTTSIFRSVLSVASKLSLPDSPVVAALSFNLKSLEKVVLPTGNLFAVINNSGNVLYHSEISRSLNENLLNVFSNPGELMSCLSAKAPGTFSTKYYGADYKVQVKPVNGLPYFIVVFESKAYDETTDMQTYSFTFAMLFLFFSFLVLQLLAVFLVSAKRSFMKKQLFDSSWIGPKKSNHKEYILSAVFNFSLLILLIIFFNNRSFLMYLFMLLLSVTMIPLFLNSIFAKKYFEKNRAVLKFKKSAIYCLAGFVMLICISAFKTLDFVNFLFLLLYAILVILLGFCVYLIVPGVKKISAFNKLFLNINYLDSFALMGLSRLIITSGIPVIFFYISSYNYEQNLNTRYKQLDFANRLVNNFPGKSADSILKMDLNLNGIYSDNSTIKSLRPVSVVPAVKEADLQPYLKEEWRTINLLRKFRLFMTDNAIMEERLYRPGADDSSFFFNHLLNKVLHKGEGSITYRQTALPASYLKIQSGNMNYRYPSVDYVNWFNGTLFWLLLPLALLIFYYIMRNIIRKLFSLNLPDLEKWKALDDGILNAKWEQPLFVIGLPGSGKKNYLLNKIKGLNNTKEKNENVFIAELIKIPSSGNEASEKIIWDEYVKQVFDEKNDIIIVNHFEYNIQDEVSNRFKLDFLERLYLENKFKIVILSTIHPVAFLDSALDHSFKQDDKIAAGQGLEKWHVLLGHYRIIVLPLQLDATHLRGTGIPGNIIHQDSGYGIPDVSVNIKGTDVETITDHNGQFALPDHTIPFTIVIASDGYETREVVIKNMAELLDISMAGPSYAWARIIRKEISQTYFLKKLQAPVIEAGKLLNEKERIARFDELAFKLQVSSHYFYMYIWQSLTKEEKFLLYDLAEDNLVNSFDDYNLSMLIAKGVVTRNEGTLKLFNKGFRNFILTAIGNSEAMKIKKQIKENGNWSTLKSPLQLVIVAILAFLLISQEEAFAKLITYVVALGAGIPAVLKLFSLFDKNTQKPA